MDALETGFQYLYNAYRPDCGEPDEGSRAGPSGTKTVMHLSFPKSSGRVAQQGRRESRGFTLVEVSLAMGVVSFGLLSLISLLTLAMDGVRGASSDLVGSQIASRIIGEMQQCPWDQVAARNGQVSHYDAQGKRVDAAAASGDLTGAAPSTGFSTYTARLVVGEVRSYGCDISVLVVAAADDRGTKMIQDYLDGKSRGGLVTVYPSQLARLEK